MRGELETVGSVIRRCLEATNPDFYRPRRPFNHRASKREIQAVQSQQLAFKFPEPVRDINRPLIDLFPEAYK